MGLARVTVILTMAKTFDDLAEMSMIIIIRKTSEMKTSGRRPT